MLQPFFDFIEKFATDFTWKRLVIFISLLTMVGVALFLYEAQTATSQLTKYERAVNIIEKLESLSTDNESTNKISANIYSGLVEITEQQSNPAAFTANISQEIKQALLASAPWALFCLFFIPGYFRGDKDATNIVGGSLALAVIVGTGGYFIPTDWGTWVGFGLYPFGANLLIFFTMMVWGNSD